jgi:hypothetical protein
MKCQATTKAGAPCTAPAVGDSRFCVMHQNPDAAKMLGARGGSRRKIAASLKPLDAPSTPTQIAAFLSQVLVETRAGLIEAKKANAISIVASAMLRSFEVAKATRRTLGDWLVIDNELRSADAPKE